MTKKRNNTEVNRPATNAIIPVSSLDYGRLVSEISDLLERARHSAARSVNAFLTATYWEIGRRIVEYEQGGKPRAGLRGGTAGELVEGFEAQSRTRVLAAGIAENAGFLPGMGDLPDTVGQI